MTLFDAYNKSLCTLEGHGIDEADFKALCLVCNMANIRNSEYRFHINDEFCFDMLSDSLDRLVSGEPLQYVIGKWDFYESEFNVGAGVLIPRPETEELVERVISYAEKIPSPIIYDLCSGSGCIGISIAKKIPSATVYCIEKSVDAFAYLKENSRGIDNVIAINDDIFNDIELPKADIIVSNPPYIKSDDIALLQSEVQHEPRMALDGGYDGLDFYRCINALWSSRLRREGKLFLEIGNEQGTSVKNVLSNFKSVEIIKDIYKNDRIVIASSID